MNKTLKTSIIAIALAGGGAIGAGSLAAASYGDEPPTLDDGTVDDVATDSDEGGDDATGDEATGDDVEPVGLQDATDGEPAEPPAPGERRSGHRGHGNPEVAAEALGVTTEELHEAREAGQSLADVAAAQGVSIEVVIQAITTEAEAHLAEEVAEGDLTQEQADERLAGLEERVTERVNEAPGEGGRGRRGLRNSEAVAEVLGITSEELHEAREAGQSLADVAAARGVSVDAVVDVIVDRVEAHIAEEVAEGDLTQEEADERLAAAEERAAEKVAATPGEGGPEGVRGGRRGPAAAPAGA